MKIIKYKNIQNILKVPKVKVLIMQNNVYYIIGL